MNSSEVVVFRAGGTLTHAVVAHPVVADFAAGPVAAGQLSEAAGATLLHRLGGDVVSHLRHLAGLAGVGAVDDRQTAGGGQVGFQRLEGVNLYSALIEASVGDVGFFGLGKKGVPSRARRSAARKAWRLSSLSWRK